MGKAILIFICMFLSLAFGFVSYASEHLLPLEESEYQEIVSMRDEVLFQINHGGARAELGRDERNWFEFYPFPENLKNSLELLADP